MVSSLYVDLIGVVSTKSWQTAPIHLQIGVFQGDPLSVLVFNTVMNTLVDTITQRHPNLGYTLAASSQRSNLLQYADDTSLLSDGPSSCQTLLSTTEAWLSWSGMKANVPKCVSLAIQASTGRPYDPRLKLNGESIPFIGKNTFSFLGAPVSVHGADKSRSNLLLKLSVLLEKVDKNLLSARQKLLLFKLAICPRLTWDLSFNHFLVSWLESTLQPIATKFLKRWSGLGKSADTRCLFLSKKKGSLELPFLVTLYKKLQVAKAAAYTCSRDPVVSVIATQETTQKEATQTSSAFKPYQVVVAAMQEDPGTTSKQVRKRAKSRVVEEDRCPSSQQHQSVQAEPATPG